MVCGYIKLYYKISMHSSVNVVCIYLSFVYGIKCLECTLAKDSRVIKSLVLIESINLFHLLVAKVEIQNI